MAGERVKYMNTLFHSPIHPLIHPKIPPSSTHHLSKHLSFRLAYRDKQPFTHCFTAAVICGIQTMANADVAAG